MTTITEHNWRSFLTKEEVGHMEKTAGVLTLAQLIRTFQWHARHRRTHEVEPCFECKAIARKLGLEV